MPTLVKLNDDFKIIQIQLYYFYPNNNLHDQSIDE